MFGVLREVTPVTGMSKELANLHGAWCACKARDRAFFMAAVGLVGELKGPVGPQDDVETWIANVREWAASHPQRQHVVDDTREDNYGHRV
jgi:hypothetical protein